MSRNQVSGLLISLISTFVLVDSLDLVCRSPSVEQTKNGSLNIILFVPLPDEDYDPAFDQGYSIIPAVEMAVEQINKRTDILPDHYFHLIVKDAGCDKATKTGIEMVALLRELLFTTKRGPIGFIGPACSEDSIFVANALHRIHNQPVLYSGTTPHLSEHADSTPNAFGMVSSMAVLTDTLIRIADEKHWNWENIAVLYDNSREHFQQSYAAFVRALSNNSHHVGYTRQIAASQIPLAEVKERNIRIVVVFSSKEPARQLACLAGQSTVNFIFPIYQFMFIGKSLEDFLEGGIAFSFMQNSDGQKYYCDKETLMRGLNGSVLINQALDSVDPNIVTVSNFTAGQIKQQYKERVKECGNTLNTTLSVTSLAYPYYDAMWALAIGMDIVFSNLGGSSFKFEAVHNALLNNVSFQGVSSWIEFNNNRHVSNSVNLLQIDQLNATMRGESNGNNLSYAVGTFIDDEFTSLKVVLHLSLIVIGFIFLFLSLLFTVILQILNTIFRSYPSVKASSARLNHFIFIGCYLLVLAVFVSTLRNVTPELSGVILCNLDIVCAILGYCLIFATIFAKSWRTYRIFNYPFESQNLLSDFSLSVFIIVFIVVELLLFIPGFVVSPFDKYVLVSRDASLLSPVKRCTIICVADSVGYVAFPLLLPFLVTIATVFLASLNRNVKYKNFRTTKQIVILAYILTIIWLLGGPLLIIFYLLKYSINLIYLLYASLLLSTANLCQFFLIVPVLAVAMDAKLKLNQTAITYRDSWLSKSFSQISVSKSESSVVYE